MNLRIFYWYSFFKELVPIYPVYSLLFLSKGLTLSEISLLLAIWSVPVVLLEIPSGILSDHWSRKKMIVLGNLFKTLCYICWFFAEGFLLFAIGFILWGVNCSLCSGSEEALLYDSLKVMEREEGFGKVLGRSYLYSGIGITLASFSGGVIAEVFGMRTPLLLSILTGLLTIIIALGFKEVNLFLKEKQDTRECKTVKLQNNHLLKTFQEALMFFRSSREILLFTLLAVFVVGTSGVLDEYDQLIAKGYGLSISLIGIWVGMRYLISALGSAIAYKLKQAIEWVTGQKERFVTISILCLTAAVCLGISGWFKHIGVMLFYALYFLITAAAYVLQEDYIQQKIEEEGRATVHSILSMINNLFGILFFGVLSIVLTQVDIHYGLVGIACYIIIVTLFLNILLKRNNI